MTGERIANHKGPYRKQCRRLGRKRSIFHLSDEPVYGKVDQVDLPLADPEVSAAIEAHLDSQVMLLSLKQFRGIYPEYVVVSDEELLDRLLRRFAPQLNSADFNKMMLKDNGKWGVTFLLTNLYEERGNGYLGSGEYTHGILEFQRIFVGAPEFGKSTERWRGIGAATTGEQYYIDTKASWPLSMKAPRFWVKSISTKGTSVMAFEFDCSSRRYRVTSNVNYDKNGNDVGSGDASDFWTDVIPDTLAEQISNGACQRSQ